MRRQGFAKQKKTKKMKETVRAYDLINISTVKIVVCQNFINFGHLP
jgi:hypothetical protein